MSYIFESLATQFNIPLWLLITVVIWVLFWKGIALWKAARANHPVWFILFLIVQTMGILEILYIFLFSKIKLEEVTKKRRKNANKI